MSSPADDRLGRLRAAWSLAWRLLLAALSGLLIWVGVVEQGTTRGYTADHPWMMVDLALGLVSVVLLIWRRRRPLTVLLLIAAIGAVAVSSFGACGIAMISLAARRQTVRTVIGATAVFVVGVVFGLVHPESDGPPLRSDLFFNVLTLAFCVACGLYIGARRELVANLRAQVEAASREQELRVGQARSAERARIAREMHDVLAHRISLVAMHAGALAYRTDLTPEQVRAAAQVVQEGAHQSLEELREVLGVLREPDRPASAPEPPQPSLEDLAELLRATESAGHPLSVRLDDRLTDLPTSLSRNAYRIVQEALTNARKHAPGSAVEVVAKGEPGADLLLTVGTAPAQGHSAQTPPGAGLGLLGLHERADLVGGDLQAGPDRRGWFVVRARLPWPAPTPTTGALLDRPDAASGPGPGDTDRANPTATEHEDKP